MNTHIADTLTEQGTIAEMNLESVLVTPSSIVSRQENNTRHYSEKVDDLVESFGGPEGQIQPITVRRLEDGKLEVIAGFRRLAAGLKMEAKNPDWKIKAEVREMTEENRIRINLSENSKRKDLSPVDQAHAIQKLLDSGMNKSGVAKLMNVSPATVTLLTSVLKLPDSIQKGVHTGAVTLHAAHGLSMLPAEEVESRYAEIVKESGGKVSKEAVRGEKAEDPEAADGADGVEAGSGKSARPGKKIVTGKQFIALAERLKAQDADETIAKKPLKEVVALVGVFADYVKGKSSENALLVKLAKLFPVLKA